MYYYYITDAISKCTAKSQRNLHFWQEFILKYGANIEEIVQPTK